MSSAATQRARQIDKLIRSGAISPKDTTLAKAIVQFLRDAVAGK